MKQELAAENDAKKESITRQEMPVAEAPKEADGAAAAEDAEAVVEDAAVREKGDTDASVSEDNDITRAKKTQVDVPVIGIWAQKFCVHVWVDCAHGD